MKRRNKRRKKQSFEIFNEDVLKIFRKNRFENFNYKQISKKLDLDDSTNRNHIIKTLKNLHGKGIIKEIERGKYILSPSKNYYTGTVDLNSRGQGYIIVNDLEDDIFIKRKYLNKALDGDLVEVYVFKRRRSGKIEGEITKILQRKRKEFVGTIQISERFAFVECVGYNMYTDIFIPKGKINKAINGDKVLVQIDTWEENNDSPTGSVIKVLGKPGEHQTEIHAILAQYGLPYEFPKDVEKYANNLDTSITNKEISKRKDMRKILTFTIDPKDAKDFDDALSFKQLENGNYEIGVHIADVSHYVKPGNTLDDEAYQRATSVYLVDRVVPMLPEILSNNVCSLRPHEEKYTFSAVFEIDDNAEIKNKWFGRTVTYSNARFAYEEAQAIIENNNQMNTGKSINTSIPKDVSLTGKDYNTTIEIAKAIIELDRLAKILRERRMREGAISFDKIEVKFRLDNKNNPEGVYFKESKDANKLIEEFMLLANRKVAEFIGKQKPKKTFVYRVHDEPDEAKLAQLQTVVSRFGHKLNFKDRNSIASSLNNLLKDVVGKKEQNLVDTLAIRTMSKAEYTTNNIGHYGLSFDYYSHFTSPIRRYPDVMTHRLLQQYLDNDKSDNEDIYEEKCKHSSHMENLATKAERDSIKYMQIRFMEDHKDEAFKGVISGVTDWGIYVEIISNKCEGMVSVRDMTDDTYYFDQDQYAMVGRNTDTIYQLGDEVIVKVKNTDLIKKHLDFYLVTE